MMASLSINTLRRISICENQAWKNTQRVLRHSGLVYRGERSESFDPEKHFNHYTARYLYLLNITTFKMRSASRFSRRIEVEQCHRMTGKHLSLNAPPFTLVPRSTRRRVDGFRQSKGEATPKSAQPFTDGLYEVLSKENDSAKLDAWIAELPLNLQEEGKEISVIGLSPQAVARPVLQSASPTFELFYQEYQSLRLKSVFKFEPRFKQLLARLSFGKQSIFRKQQYRVKSQLLERLGNVLFFTSLCSQGCLEELIDAPMEKGSTYLKVFPGEGKVKAHQEAVNYIEALCNKMTEKCLMSAAGRHYEKKKIVRNESGES